MVPKPDPPAVASTNRTPGIERISVSTRRMTSSIAARLVPSGAVMVTWNSASSTSLGIYSCLTHEYSGTDEAITGQNTDDYSMAQRQRKEPCIAAIDPGVKT